MMEYTGTVIVLEVTDVVEFGGDLREAYSELDAEERIDW